MSLWNCIDKGAFPLGCLVGQHDELMVVEDAKLC